MNLFKVLAAICVAVLVSACGGSSGGQAGAPILGGGNTTGGSSGGGTPTQAALFTTAPETLIVPLGASSATFSIQGGVPGYSIASNNTAVAAVVSSGASFTVNGLVGGNATISIKDSVGAEVQIKVEVSSSSASLFTSAPGSLTVAVGAATQEYSIGGGNPAYSVTSSNTAVASVGVNGSRFIVSGMSGGKAVVTVKDAVGASIQIEVMVGSSTSLYTTAPAQVSMAVGATHAYVIGGGASPYSVASSNSTLISASVTGSGLSLTGIAPGSTKIVVRDAVGTTISIDATVGSGGVGVPLFTSAASDIVVAPGSTPTYTISGGTGPYSVSTSNAAIARAAISGVTTLSITGVVPGGAKVVVLDSVGAKVEINVLVGTGATVALYTTAPPTLVLANGVNQSYAIGGGVGPYVVASSNVVVSSATVIGSTLSVSGISTGKALISVFDSLGKFVTIDVTVSPATDLYSTAPSAISTAIGATASFVIGGGSSPYVATSSNLGAVTVSVNGTALAINGIAAGSSQVLVRDSTGATISINVTVPVGAALYTTSPATIQVAIGSAVAYTVGGGTAPYTVTSSSTGVATVSLSGTTFTVTGVSAGTSQLLVRDAVGASSTVNVTVAATSPLASSAPSSVTIAPATMATYTVTGGVAPYYVTSSNTSVIGTNIAGSSVTITAVASGSAIALLRDSMGATTAINVTVGPTAALYTSANPDITMATGASTTYSIGGGSGGYSATTSNASVAAVSVLGNAITITGVGAGTAKLLVRDAVGATVTISLTVGSSIPLFSSAPQTVTLLPGAIPPSSYTIGGGAAPYVAASSNTSITTATINGNALSLTGVAAGSASVVISDALGAKVTINVTVTPVASTPLAVTPLSTTASVGDTLNFTISGGDPVYTLTVNNPKIANVTQSGSTFTVELLNAGATTIAVFDSKGQAQTITLTATQDQPLLRTSPTSIAVSELDSKDIRLDIYGGKPPYSVFTSDMSLSSVSVSNTPPYQVTVGVGTNNNRCISNSLSGYISPSGANTKTYGDWALTFGSFGVVITVIDSVGSSTNTALIIVDNGITCPPPP